MKRKYLKYLYTFIGVALSVFVIGFLGVSYSLQLMQDKYLEIQIDANKRHAENMARILAGQIERGNSPEDVRKRFQESIQGTETQEGFLCMFNTDGKNICHPNPDFIGMDSRKMPAQVHGLDNSTRSFSDFIIDGKASGGRLEIESMKLSEIVFLTPVKGTDWMLASHENIKEVKMSISMFRGRLIFGFSLLGLFIALVSAIVARRINHKYENQIEEQKNEIETKHIHLQELHEEVQAQKNAIEERNRNISSSIVYAQRIQRAILPSEKKIQEKFDDYFILWKPRDIVSGDFYWFKEVEHNGKTLHVIAAADSTGHGVPGAFMSILGITLLNEVVRKGIVDANEILNELRLQVKTSLKQDQADSNTRDGMDIAIVVIDKANMKLQFSGAYNPLYLFRNGELTEFEATRNPIGVYLKEIPFVNHEMSLQTGDVFYMFSDGFYDQPGGTEGNRMKKKRFRSTLKEVHHLPMNEQKANLEHRLNKWMGEQEQIDDILLMGIRI